MYSSAVFTGVDVFALNFYLDRVVPINHSWRQKTRDTGLPYDEDRIPLCSCSLILIDTILECDGFCGAMLKWMNGCSGGSGTFSLGGRQGFWSGAFNRNNYRSPTANYTMQVFGSDA